MTAALGVDRKVHPQRDHGDGYYEVYDQSGLEANKIRDSLEPDHEDSKAGAGEGDRPVGTQGYTYHDQHPYGGEHNKWAGECSLILDFQAHIYSDAPR